MEIQCAIDKFTCHEKRMCNRVQDHENQCAIDFMVMNKQYAIEFKVMKNQCVIDFKVRKVVQIS